MRPGGGKDKGSQFERQTGAALSEWITGGDRKDLFSRNVLSGGRFTNQQKKGEKLGIAGDLMAAHPLAFEFLSNFVVECKHYADLGFRHYLFDRNTGSFLARVVEHTAAQAHATGLTWMVVARQNRLPTVLLMAGPIGEAARQQRHARAALHYHSLHRGAVCMMQFDEFLKLVRPAPFLAAVAEQRNV